MTTFSVEHVCTRTACAFLFNLFLDSAKEHVCTHTSMSNKS